MPDSKEILRLMSVGAYPNVYVLGCNCRRVTFYAQQCRAFNLVWALFDAGILSAGKSIGVVGAGLGGMTVAAALALKNCAVTVFEQDQKELHLQRQNVTRYIHPRIYDWPAAEASSPRTDLPCLNWHAGKADQVVEQVLDQWKRFTEQGLITVRRNFAVQDVSVQSGRPAVNGNGPGWDSCPFDCAILAVGFGKERFLGEFGNKSYWQIEAFHQRDLGHTGVKRVLVSGCGDGGLIDVQRLSLDNFKHELLLTDFFPESAIAPLRPHLLQIDAAAKGVQDDGVGHFIHDAYKKLSLPSELTDTFRARKRTDTEVTLNGSGLTPFSLNASLLNRFCIFLLLQSGLRYKPGRLLMDQVKSCSPGFEVAIEKPNGTFDIERYDELILRHGPEPVINALLPAGGAEELSLKLPSESDITMTRSWPGSFYPRTPLCDLPSLETQIGRDIVAMLDDSGLAAALNSAADGSMQHSAAPGAIDGITPHFVYDQHATEYATNIFKALRDLNFPRVDSLAVEAGEWLQLHRADLQTSALRELAKVLMRSAISRASRHRDEPQLFADQCALAKQYSDMAKEAL